MERSVHEEMHKFLIEKCSTKLEGYYNIELMKLFPQAFPSMPWYHVLGCLFRDSQISYVCFSAIEFARNNGYLNFISSHTFIDSLSNYIEPTSRISLSRTKKLPNYCDTQSWKNYFTLFCSPALIGNYSKSATTNNASDSHYLSSVNISQVFDRAVSLLKVDYNEFRDMACEALCLTHSTLVIFLLGSMNSLLKEIIEQKLELNTRKKRKRDVIVIKILFIFSNIARSDHFSNFVKCSDPKILKTFLDFCEFCNLNIIPSLDGVNISDGPIIDLACIISSVCRGLFQSYNASFLSISSRGQYYRSFYANQNSGATNIITNEKQNTLFEALFSLLYIETLFSNSNFPFKLDEILKHIDIANSIYFIRNKSMVLNIIETLMLSNEYSQELTDWAINKVYETSSKFSLQLFFIILDYLEKKNHFQHILIRILSLIFIHSCKMDSIMYLRIRKSLLFLQQKIESSSVSFLPLPQKENQMNFQEYIVQHIIATYSKYLITIVSELFKIFNFCELTFRIKILFCLEKIFKHLRFQNHPDYPYTNDLNFIENQNIETQKIDFEKSLLVLTNLTYITWMFNVNHSFNLQACWIATFCQSNDNCLLILHYLLSLGYYHDETVHLLLKIIAEYIYSYNSEIFYKFIISNLNNEQNPKMKIVSCKTYPYIFIKSVSYSTKIDSNKTSINLLTPTCQQFTVIDPDNIKISQFYSFPIYNLLKKNSSISSNAVLLIYSSYLLSYVSFGIDEDFIVLLHLAINVSSDIDKYYKIFNMFRNSNKRKDVNLFLNILFNDILDKLDTICIKFLIKFFTDVIGLAEFRCIRNGLLLLNILIDYVGSQCIPKVSKTFLLDNLPSFIKINAFSKISFEISARTFVSSDYQDQGCPHKYMHLKFNNTSNYECKICIQDSPHEKIYEWIVSNNFFYQPNINSFESNIKQFFESSINSSDYSLFQPVDILFSVIPSVDYEIRTQRPNSDSSMPPPDTYSINSTQLIDDIIDTINFLDRELGTNKTQKSTYRKFRHNSTTVARLSASKSLVELRQDEMLRSFSSENIMETSKSHYTHYSSENFLDKFEFTSDKDELTGDKDELRAEKDELTADKNESVQSRLLENSSATESNVNLTVENTNYTLNAPSLTNINAPVNSYLDGILTMIFFVTDTSLRSNWDKSCVECIRCMHNNDKSSAILNFIKINSILPILIHRIFNILDSTLKDYYFQKKVQNILKTRE
ncbi:hypothetical protein HZS_1258, partial [Henneguya salminicola]